MHVGRWAAEREVAVQPDPARRGGRDPGVVALGSTARHQAVGAVSHRILGQERELAGLVATQGQTGEVVALDEQRGACLKVFSEPLESLDRRRQDCEIGALTQRAAVCA